VQPAILPTHPPDPPMSAPHEAGGGPDDAAEAGLASILVVDDDARNLQALQEVLRGLDCRIVAAISGEEALRCILRRDFALILMDVRMPGLNGYETAELIRSRERSRHVPIIFLTAFDKDDTHVFRGYSAGAVDYVFKPIDPTILRSKISVFVELHNKTEEIRRKAEQEKRLLQENFRIRSEKLRSEQALRRREEQQSLIIRSLPLALYTIPAEEAIGGRRFASDNAERVSGFPAERFAEDPHLWEERLHPEDRERVLAELDAILEAGSVTIEYRWTHADGGERYVLDQAVLTRDPQGRPREIFGTWLDITERKHLEQQLVHAQKLEAIGKLTGGIAHDFNNMLNIVIGNLDLLNTKVSGSEAERFAKAALNGALRCAELTQRLLTFARRQPLDPRVIDLNEFIPAMVDMLQRTLGDKVTVEVKTTPDLWPVEADPTQVEAALVNLAVNSRDAMPEGGRIEIGLGNVSWSEEDAARIGEAKPGDYVAIAVSDDGAGIPPDILGRVLEPFFTTKGIGHGTGLGLSTTYGFAKQSGGHMSIDSAVGQGTTVTVYLPRAKAGAAAAADASIDVPVRVAAGGERVLVVEDDPDVREVAVRTLEEMGFTVLQAEDGASALDLIEREQGLRLLFTDLAMPGMSGRDLARQACERRADLKVLYASGYDAEEGAGEENGLLLRKPYRREELASRVGVLLAPANAAE
jgi:PAS domain S-box-containing protein